MLFAPTSLATDPATGITYVFLQGPDGSPSVLGITVATDTVGLIAPLANEYFVEGRVAGVDFDQATGELYFNYQSEPSLTTPELLKFTTGPATWGTAAPVFISTAPANDVQIDQLALTIEYTALAATGSELPIAAIVFLGSFAVIAGGVTVVAARRRADAGTV